MLVIHEGETAAEVMDRVQKKLRVPDEEFSKVLPEFSSNFSEHLSLSVEARSEERRVGKECRL